MNVEFAKLNCILIMGFIEMPTMKSDIIVLHIGNNITFTQKKTNPN